MQMTSDPFTGPEETGAPPHRRSSLAPQAQPAEAASRLGAATVRNTGTGHETGEAAAAGATRVKIGGF